MTIAETPEVRSRNVGEKAQIYRSSFYNLLGMGLPLVVAIFTIPILIDGLGASKFGILTLIWAIVSYLGLFDLGLGRGLTQRFAVARENASRQQLEVLVGTANSLMAALGVFAGILLWTFGFWFVSTQGARAESSDLVGALAWMAITMPAIILTTGLRGLLEAIGRFDIVNMVRLPMGVFTFLGPSVAVMLGYTGLDVIAGVLALGRIAGCLVHYLLVKRFVPDLLLRFRFTNPVARDLLSFGGWATVSNVVGPLMGYLDRFVLAAMISAAAAAYYATPQELILRLAIVPAAISTVLFPAFARQSADVRNERSELKFYSLLVGALMLPLLLPLGVFARPLLAMWISAEFAESSYRILQVLAAAAWFSSISQVPFTMLQGHGRVKTTAFVHLVELPFYASALVGMIVYYGTLGAAIAWCSRVVADTIAMFVLANRRVGDAPSMGVSGQP